MVLAMFDQVCNICVSLWDQLLHGIATPNQISNQPVDKGVVPICSLNSSKTAKRKTTSTQIKIRVEEFEWNDHTHHWSKAGNIYFWQIFCFRMRLLRSFQSKVIERFQKSPQLNYLLMMGRLLGMKAKYKMMDTHQRYEEKEFLKVAKELID